MTGGMFARSSVVGHGYDVSVSSKNYGDDEAEAGFLPQGKIISLVGVDTEDGPDLVGVCEEVVGNSG